MNKDLDYERIMLLLAVIHKAAECGLSNLPFVGEAHKELSSMGYPTPPVDMSNMAQRNMKYGAEQVEERPNG